MLLTRFACYNLAAKIDEVTRSAEVFLKIHRTSLLVKALDATERQEKEKPDIVSLELEFIT